MPHPTITLERLDPEADDGFVSCDIVDYGHDERKATFEVQAFTHDEIHVGELFVCDDHIPTAYTRLVKMSEQYA